MDFGGHVPNYICIPRVVEAVWLVWLLPYHFFLFICNAIPLLALCNTCIVLVLATQAHLPILRKYANIEIRYVPRVAMSRLTSIKAFFTQSGELNTESEQATGSMSVDHDDSSE